MNEAFRDGEEAARMRLEVLTESTRDLRARYNVLRQVYLQRTGRIVWSIPLLIAAVVLYSAAGLSLVLDLKRTFAFRLREFEHGAQFTLLLDVSWLAAFTLGWIAHTRRARVEPGAQDRDVYARIAWLESLPARTEEIARKVRKVSRAAIYAPLVALLSLLGLSLHRLVSIFHISRADFSFWILLSVLITTHVNIVVFVFAARFAREARRDPPEEVRKRVMRRAILHAILAAAVSCVPFLMIYLIPPVFVLVTALVSLPITYRVSIVSRLNERTRMIAAGIPDLDHEPVARVAEPVVAAA